MVLGLLAVHQSTHHGKAAVGRQHWGTTSPGGEPRTYNMDFPTAGRAMNFPIKGCRVWAATRTEMQFHFLHRHVWDTVIILYEVNLPHLR